MKILHIGMLTFREGTGPRTSVPSLLRSQQSFSDHEVGMVIGGKSHFSDVFEGVKNVFRIKGSNPIPELKQILEDFGIPDVVVFHSTYILEHLLISWYLKRKKIPYIIVPRGGFTRTSINSKLIKKTVANILFFNRFIKSALGVHYLSVGEKNASIFHKSSFIVPNGIKQSNLELSLKKKCRRIIFIGRIDILHKGLDILVNSVNESSTSLRSNGISVEIYGSGSKNQEDQLKSIISKNGLNDLVYYSGSIYGERKSNVLSESDVFIHTSRFEGLPMSVLEALSYGLPCIVTQGTNISDIIVETGSGWDVSDNKLSDLLKIIHSIDLSKYSQNALKCSKTVYNWNKIAKSTVSKYQELIKRM